ncbi:MAG: transcription antitermination factor NusB [Armatimonadetes bacterium]|nr:transcription antitermination factor NusB [Armatimonadota bacterium]
MPLALDRGAPMTPFAWRRIARECALRALYTADLGQGSLSDALHLTIDSLEDEEQSEELVNGVELFDATIDLVDRFATALAEGTWKSRVSLDRAISAAIPDYDFSRLALVDRSVLRLALYELQNYPYIPPAVTLNEAIEMAKKYSTTESGKFVNGVLHTLLNQTEKANYDPKTAPKDPDLGEIEKIMRTPEPVVEEETVDADSEEGKIAKRYGVWKVKGDEKE